MGGQVCDIRALAEGRVMRVLLTGASGFVGRYVLKELVASGHEVIAVSRTGKPNANSQNASWLMADLLTEEGCKVAVGKMKPDVLIHLAWYAEHGKFWDARENFDWSRATVLLMQKFAETGGKRVVIAGTCAEYDWQYGYFKENVAPTVPNTVYGSCKDATRRLTQALSTQSGIQWVWGRIFFPLGVGEPANKLLSSVIRGLMRNEIVKCTHGQQLRDFMPVEEVASALVHLACGTESEGEFNISTGRPTSIRELVEYCAEQIGSVDAPQFGAIGCGSNEAPMVVGDCMKLIKTGWAQRLDWREAVKNMINEYKQHIV